VDITLVRDQHKQQATGKALLTNSLGDYVLLDNTTSSKYDGWFVFEKGEMYRVLNFSSFAGKAVASKDSLEIQDPSIKELHLHPTTHQISVQLNKPLQLLIDLKKSYDNRAYGRYYSIEKQDNILLIHINKQNDLKDTDSRDDEYKLTIAIKGDNLKFTEQQEWVKESYKNDKKRNAGPFERHIFSPGTISAATVTLAFGLTPQEAIARLHTTNTSTQSIKSNDLATQCCIETLRDLWTPTRVFAGLPWFFQEWIRDTAISLGAANHMGRTNEARTILLDVAKTIINAESCKGKAPSHQGSTLCTADGAGWTFHRLHQLYNLKPLLLEIHKPKLIDWLDHHLTKIEKNHLDDFLVSNGPLETWMDTGWESDSREGCCIEIQALTLATCAFYETLTGKKHSLHKTLKKSVRKLWNGSYLNDKRGDLTKRPNVFIAAYVFPEICSKEKWEQCFDEIIPALWLDWGGLSTIDKAHPLFTPNYTGQTNQSYHRGDSWYWINNLAAIVLHKLNPEKYKEYIDKIYSASKKEILEMGAIGHHGEVSSADKQESQGCLSQSWSAALFLELSAELNKN
jgi:glycogen debranching enzyme